jgi:O-antigen/teichoic acid export membrane protein
MSLFKTSLWSLIIVIISTFVGFVSQKLYAIYTGAEGLIAIGNFNNFSSIIYIVASGGIYGGIVKVIAEKTNPIEQNSLLKPIYTILFFYSIVTTLVLFFTNQMIHPLLYKDLGVSWYVNYLFYLMLPFIIFSTGLLYVLNGKKNVRKYSILSILLHIVNLIFTLLLVIYFGINGALLSLFLPTAFTFFIFVIFSKDDFSWPTLKILPVLKSGLYKSLINFSLVSILSIVLLSVSQLVIRDLILSKFSVSEGSYWQILSNFSKIWMAVITGVLSMYFYPQIASLSKKISVKKEVQTILTIGIPLLSLSFLFVFIFKDNIIRLVYSEDFSDATDYFLYQLIGDVLKTSGLVFGFFLLAKNKLKYYAITEVVFTIVYIVLSYIMTDTTGVKGVFYAYILSYLLYLFIQIGIFRNYLKEVL